MADRKKTSKEYADIIIRSSFAGNELRLGDLGEIIDGYADNDQASFYNGKEPAVRLVVYRVGSETPIDVAEATKEYLEVLRSQLPNSAGFHMARSVKTVTRSD